MIESETIYRAQLLPPAHGPARHALSCCTSASFSSPLSLDSVCGAFFVVVDVVCAFLIYPILPNSVFNSSLLFIIYSNLTLEQALGQLSSLLLSFLPSHTPSYMSLSFCLPYLSPSSDPSPCGWNSCVIMVSTFRSLTLCSCC